MLYEVITQEEMRARIKELGKQITADYTGKDLARRQAERGQRCRLADRAAGDRDPGRRRFRLHPDQRDFDS